MTEPLPIVLIPGLACSVRLYAAQLPDLWRYGPVTIADPTHDDAMSAIARRILDGAPPRFALAGLSMGGYISMEIMRQAPERVIRLALLDTTARPDTPEQRERRLGQIALAGSGGYAEVIEQLFPLYVHQQRHNDKDLHRQVQVMADEVGAEAFVRQQTAILGRIDSRPGLADIACPTLVLVGDGDALTPPDRAEEIASIIPGARLVVVQDCGHLSAMERPSEVSAALEAWVRD